MNMQDQLNPAVSSCSRVVVERQPDHSSLMNSVSQSEWRAFHIVRIENDTARAESREVRFRYFLSEFIFTSPTHALSRLSDERTYKSRVDRSNINQVVVHFRYPLLLDAISRCCTMSRETANITEQVRYFYCSRLFAQISLRKAVIFIQGFLIENITGGFEDAVTSPLRERNAANRGTSISETQID